MRFLLICISGLLYSVAGKTATKSLTESLGQEVIELASPLKDLNPDIEEEPSAEVDEPEKVTSTLVPGATAKDIRKANTIETRRKIKDIDRNKQEDEEAKIEKELAEMYKDTDYKADSAENIKEESTVLELKPDANEVTADVPKPIARARNNFKFQPDSNNPKEVERFRTSIDDINCENNKLSAVTESVLNSGHMITVCRAIFWGLFALI